MSGFYVLPLARRSQAPGESNSREGKERKPKPARHTRPVLARLAPSCSPLWGSGPLFGSGGSSACPLSLTGFGLVGKLGIGLARSASGRWGHRPLRSLTAPSSYKGEGQPLRVWPSVRSLGTSRVRLAIAFSLRAPDIPKARMGARNLRSVRLASPDNGEQRERRALWRARKIVPSRIKADTAPIFLSTANGKLSGAANSHKENPE